MHFCVTNHETNIILHLINVEDSFCFTSLFVSAHFRTFVALFFLFFFLFCHHFYRISQNVQATQKTASTINFLAIKFYNKKNSLLWELWCWLFVSGFLLQVCMCRHLKYRPFWSIVCICLKMWREKNELNSYEVRAFMCTFRRKSFDGRK